MYGGDGADSMYGGYGDDYLDGLNTEFTAAADFIDGGAGTDTVRKETLDTAVNYEVLL
jgi:Ca2+-binding RTX toxin-like protein